GDGVGNSPPQMQQHGPGNSWPKVHLPHVESQPIYETVYIPPPALVREQKRLTVIGQIHLVDGFEPKHMLLYIGRMQAAILEELYNRNPSSIFVEGATED